MPATGTNNTSLEPHVPAWAGRSPYRPKYRLIHPLLQPRYGKDTGDFYHQDFTLKENTLCCLQPGVKGSRRQLLSQGLQSCSPHGMGLGRRLGLRVQHSKRHSVAGAGNLDLNFHNRSVRLFLQPRHQPEGVGLAQNLQRLRRLGTRVNIRPGGPDVLHGNEPSAPDARRS